MADEVCPLCEGQGSGLPGYFGTMADMFTLLFAFFFFLPFSDHLKYINDDKKVESALHLEAAMLLYDKVHPIMVQERLNAFLARKDRFTDED